MMKMKIMARNLLSLMLAVCLLVNTAPMPVYALAPSTRFSAKSPLMLLNESEEFKKRTLAMLNAWIEGEFGDRPGAFGEAMREADHSARSGIKNSQWVFRYKFHPLGPDVMYCDVGITEGPLEGHTLHCVLNKENRSAMLLDRKEMNNYLQILALGERESWPTGPVMQSLAGAVNGYYRKIVTMANRDQRYASHWTGYQRRVAHVHLAHEAWRSLDQGSREKIWAMFMLKTVLHNLPVNEQVAFWQLYILSKSGNVGKDLREFFFEQAREDNAMRVCAEDMEGQTYAQADAPFKVLIVEKILMGLGVSKEESQFLKNILIRGPWKDASFFPPPDWMREKGYEGLFAGGLGKMVAKGELSRDALERFAEIGYLNVYRPLLQDKGPDDATTPEQKIWNLLTELRRDARDMEKIRGPEEKVRFRLVREIMTPAERRTPVIHQAEKIVENMSSFVHDARKYISSLQGYIHLFLDADMQNGIVLLPEGPTKEQITQTLKKMLKNIKIYLDTVAPLLQYQAVGDEESAKAIIGRTTNAARECMLKLELLRTDFEQLKIDAIKAGGVSPRLDQLVVDIPRMLADAQSVFDMFFSKEGQALEVTQRQRRWTDLSKVITKETIEDRFKKYYLNGIPVTVRCAPDLPEVNVDEETFMRLILGHFISNAGENTGGNDPKNPQDGKTFWLKLELRTDPDKNWVYVDIQDNGSGIDRSVQSHIFQERFTTKDARKGTGLGLSDARKLMHEYGGKIEVKSATGGPDRGTVFTLALPTKKSLENAVPSGDALLGPTQNTALSVLRFRGDGNSAMVEEEAKETAARAMKAALDQTAFEGEHMSNPVLNSAGIVDKNSSDTLSQVVFAEKGGMKELPPNLYLNKLIVGKDAAGARIDVTDSIQENLHRVAEKLRDSRNKTIDIPDLRVAVLFRPRHRSLIRDMIRAGVTVQHPGPEARAVDRDSDEDFERFWNEVERHMAESGYQDLKVGNLILLGQKDVEAVHGLHEGGKIDLIAGADDTAEGLMSAALTEIYGGYMSAQLVSKENLDTVLNPDLQRDGAHFTRSEREVAERLGFRWRVAQKNLGPGEYSMHHVFSSSDLAHAAQLFVVATAIKDSTWIEGLKGVHVDPITGDKTVQSLVASKGGSVRILEMTYPGNYLEMEQGIEDERDLEIKAKRLEQFARVLVQDGLYEQALETLEKAQALQFSPHLEVLQRYVSGLHMVVSLRGREEDARKLLAEATKRLSAADPLAAPKLISLLERTPPPKVMERTAHFKWEYDIDSGKVFLFPYDNFLGDFHSIPITAGLIYEEDGLEKTVMTDQYKVHEIKKSDWPQLAYTITYSHRKKSPELPDIMVRYAFFKDVSAVRVTMEIANRTGKQIQLKKYILLAGDEVVLGRNKSEMAGYQRRSLGVWVHQFTRLSMAIGFDKMGSGPVQDAVVLGTKGDASTIRAMADAGDIESRPDVAALTVRVDQHEFGAIPGYALWRAGKEFSPPAVSSQEITLEAIRHEQKLSDVQWEALGTAVLLSKPTMAFLDSAGWLPADIASDASLRKNLNLEDAKGIVTARHEQPSLYVLNLGKNTGWLVALFNPYRHPTNWDLKLGEHLGLDPQQSYVIKDLWRNELLGGSHGYLIKGNYHFHGEERLPLGGVKFLWIASPAMSYGPQRPNLDVQIHAGEKEASAP